MIVARYQQSLRSSQNIPKQSSESDMVRKIDWYCAGRFIAWTFPVVVEKRDGEKWAENISDHMRHPFPLEFTRNFNFWSMRSKDSERMAIVFRNTSAMKVQSSGARVHAPDPLSKMSFRIRGNDAESANQKPQFAPEFLLCFAFPSRFMKGNQTYRRRFIIRPLSDLCSI